MAALPHTMRLTTTVGPASIIKKAKYSYESGFYHTESECGMVKHRGNELRRCYEEEVGEGLKHCTECQKIERLEGTVPNGNGFAR
jgi:hypothetical protein